MKVWKRVVEAGLQRRSQSVRKNTKNDVDGEV